MVKIEEIRERMKRRDSLPLLVHPGKPLMRLQDVLRNALAAHQTKFREDRVFPIYLRVLARQFHFNNYGAEQVTADPSLPKTMIDYAAEEFKQMTGAKFSKSIIIRFGSRYCAGELVQLYRAAKQSGKGKSKFFNELGKSHKSLHEITQAIRETRTQQARIYSSPPGLQKKGALRKPLESFERREVLAASLKRTKYENLAGNPFFFSYARNRFQQVAATGETAGGRQFVQKLVDFAKEFNELREAGVPIMIISKNGHNLSPEKARQIYYQAREEAGVYFKPVANAVLSGKHASSQEAFSELKKLTVEIARRLAYGNATHPLVHAAAMSVFEGRRSMTEVMRNREALEGRAADISYWKTFRGSKQPRLSKEARAALEQVLPHAKKIARSSTKGLEIEKEDAEQTASAAAWEAIQKGERNFRKIVTHMILRVIQEAPPRPKTKQLED